MGKSTTGIFEVGQGEEKLHDDALLVLLLLGRDGARGGLGRGSCLAARTGLPAFLLSTEVSGRPRILLILQLSRDLLIVAAGQGRIQRERVSVKRDLQHSRRHSLCRVGRVVHTSAAIDDADLLVSSRLLGRQTCKVASGSSRPVELRVDKVTVRLVDVPD